jgi:hypothetical protein
MRAVVQCSLALVSFAAIVSGRVLAETLAQPPEETRAQPPEGIEEVVVRGGKTLSQYRLELERAHDALLELFNESNEGDDTDVRCRNEAPTGTRIPQRVCWSHAQDRAGAAGARQFLNALLLSGKPGNADRAITQAMTGAEIAGRTAEVRFQEEWERVLGGDQQFAEAVAEYAELKAEFDRLSGVTSISAPQPREVLLGPAGPQCEASTLTEFEQRNNVARVSGTVSISMCPAGTMGSLTLVANVRNDAGALTPIEFSETWQHADAQDHVFSSDYPIGENVFLQSVRVRNLECSCAGPTQ